MTRSVVRTTRRYDLGFRAHTPETAAGRARDVLDGLWQRHDGAVAAMTRTMAGSPSVLEGYLELSRAMKRSTLRRHVSELVSLAVQQRLDCALCLASHTAAARAVGVSHDDIALPVPAPPPIPPSPLCCGNAVLVHDAPREVTADVADRLRGLGYTDRQLLDVVGLVALNHLTGAFNLVAGVEPSEDRTTSTETSASTATARG